MGIGDKMKNAAESAKGKIKEKTGDATDNEDLQAEGQKEKSVADLEAGRRKGQGRFQAVTGLHPSPHQPTRPVGTSPPPEAS